MNARRALLIVAGVMLLAGGAVFVTAAMMTNQNDAKVRRLAAPELRCPEASIEIVERRLSDTGELYVVKGCGHAGELLCSAPDFECFFNER